MFDCWKWYVYNLFKVKIYLLDISRKCSVLKSQVNLNEIYVVELKLRFRYMVIPFNTPFTLCKILFHENVKANINRSLKDIQRNIQADTKLITPSFCSFIFSCLFVSYFWL